MHRKKKNQAALQWFAFTQQQQLAKVATPPEPQGPSAGIEEIDPQKAQEIVEGTDRNRKVSPRRVTRYAAMMTRQKWIFTGESVILNGEKLLDGSHRLRAIIQSGITLRMVVVRGVDPEAFKYIDSGASRSLSDSLYIEQRPYPRLFAAAVNYLTGFLLWNRWTLTGVEIPDRWNTIEKYPEMEDIIPLYASMRQIELLPGISRGILIAAHTLFNQKDPDLAAELADTLIGDSGDLPDGHPVKAYHAWWASQIKRDPAPRDLNAKTGNGLVRVWNAMRKHEQIDKLRPPTACPEIE